jgi:transcriptional regulator, LysR family
VRGVAERGTLTACAEELCLTQSALSHTVRRLEDRLGTAIWRREGKRLLPTRAGAYLLAVAVRVLPQLEQAEERLRQFASGRRGSLRFGMECHPCYPWLRPLIAPYLWAWPDVELDVRQKFQFGGVAALFSGEIDLLVTPDPIQHAALHFVPVFDYEQVLVVSTRHRLATKKILAPEDLQSEAVLSYPVPRERLDLFSHFLNPAGVHPGSI